MNYKIPVILIQNTVIYHWILGWPTHLPNCLGLDQVIVFPGLTLEPFNFMVNGLVFLGKKTLIFQKNIGGSGSDFPLPSGCLT